MASRAAYERALQVMPGGSTRSSVFAKPFPIYAKSGQGARIRDLDGNEYLDFHNNFTALIHGYGHPAITEALIGQIYKGLCFAHPTEHEIEMAELLCRRVLYFEHVRFTNTGSEAVMMAIKAARAITGRSKIAKCEGAYHGNYDYVEVSFDTTPDNWGPDRPQAIAYNKGTPRSVLDEVVVIPFNDIAGTERALDPHRRDLAAVVIDPLPSRLGLVPVAKDYLGFVRRFTKKHGILLVSDEVLSFRLSHRGAMVDLGVTPDLCAFGKIIGGGLPIGALAGPADLMRVFDPSKGKPAVSQAGTFTANPLSLVAGTAAMRAMTPDAYDKINQLGDYAREQIQNAFRDLEVPGQATGAGSLFRIFFHRRDVTSYRSAYPLFAELRHLDALINAIRDGGVLLSPIGLGAVSTAMTISDIDRFIGALRAGLLRMLQAAERA